MSLFSWGKKDDSPRVDEHAQSLGTGANASAPVAGTVAAHTVAQARESALNLSATSKRGRPRKDAGAVQSDQQRVQSALNEEIARQLDAVHDPKAWGALLAAPADVAVTLTGRDYWEVSKDERETLGATGAMAARTMMITNPKGLAFLMLSAAMFSVYMPRLTKELAHQRKEKEKEAKANEPKSA